MSAGWYVAQTKPNAERAAVRRLWRQEFTIHLPWLTVRTTRRGQRVDLREPLFPGYLFILLDLELERWKAVNSTRGVQTLLPAADAPRPIPTKKIEELYEGERDGLFAVPPAPIPGTLLRVYRGTFVDQIVEVLAAGADRTKCLLGCFGQRTVISLPTDDLTVLR